MIYAIDLIFVTVYLTCEKLTTKIQNKRLRWFFKVREILQWLQFLSIIIYLYGRPIHTETERLVSFGAMVFTKLVFDCIGRYYCIRDRKRLLDAGVIDNIKNKDEY